MRLLQLILCSLPILAGATEIPEKDWEYERLDDDHVVIHSADQSRRAAAIDPETEGDVTVPSSLRSMQVVSIGEKAFYNCSMLTSVTIPEGVTNIGDNAFYGCSSLTNVVFPTSLKSIGTYAFYNCSKLSSANFTGASLTIGSHAFRNCSRIGRFSFSGDSISIGEHAFSGCTGLLDAVFETKSVAIGKCSFSIYSEYYTIYSQACTALTNLQIRAADASLATVSFSGCTALRRVDVLAQSFAVGERAFSKYNYYDDRWTTSCTALDRVTIGADTMAIGDSAFSECSALKDASLVGSESATIGESAFYSCSKLRRIELPEALKAVSKTSFSHCTSLEAIVFTTNLTQIAYQAFDTCTSLESVGFQEGLQSVADQAFYGCESITNIVFPQSLASVGARAFEKCENLAAVVFSEGNTNQSAAASVTIGERAFYQCESLASVALSQAVSSLGSRAFSQCGALATVNLPTNFTELAESAFEDCSALSSVDLPVTLVSIGNTVFFGCTNLATFLIPTNHVVSLGAKSFKNTKYWNEYPNDLVANNGYILGFKNDPVNVELPDGCKAIPVAMFEGMTTIKSVTIPDTVTEIGSRAFNGCSGITNLAFNSVTAVGNSAFEGCSSLSAISLSEVLTAIPGNCFKDCTSLLAIDIPANVSSIGEYAFCNCASLVDVTGGGGVATVGSYAFAQCPKMKPFEFPNDVAYGDHVFQGCTWTEHVLFPAVGTLKDEYPASYANITSIVFSTTLTTITNGACAGCAALAYVRVPDGVTSIGALAFDGCTSLTSVVMAASVASVAADAFKDCPRIRSAVVSGAYSMQHLFPSSYANLARVDFVDGVTSLCSNFMDGCSSVAAIRIPETVTSIGPYAFRACTGFSSFDMPTNFTSIAAGTFAGCTGLLSFVVPDGVSAIDSQAFEGCSSLVSVSMPASVTSVQSDSFEGCTAIGNLVVSGQFPVAAAFPDACANLTEIGIADEATELCNCLFSNCVSLTAVGIPWRVTTIGDGAFYGCSSLESVVVPECVETIGDEAFGFCLNLETVDYLCDRPESVPTNVYVGTGRNMKSRVLPYYGNWLSATNSAGAGVLPFTWNDRLIVYWGTVLAKLAHVRFSDNTNRGGVESQYYLANAGREILTLPEGPSHPFNTNLVFQGWYTAASGGEKIEDGRSVTGSVVYYAHWSGDDEEESEEEEEEEEDPEVAYDFSRANKYCGAVLDGETVVGNVQISFAKGKTNKTTGETAASATAKILLLGESQLSMKGTLSEDGTAALTVSRSTREMNLEIGSDNADCLTGSLDGYEIVAYRDLFSSTDSEDKKRAAGFLALVKGKSVAILAAEGGAAFASGYAALSVNVGAKGRVKVSGYMPDGVKVSSSAQLVLVPGEGGDDTGYVPVVVPMYSKKGGFALALSFDADGICAISGLSDWIADKTGTTVGLSCVGIRATAGLADGEHAFAADLSFLSIADADIDDSLSPDGTVFAATAKKWTLPKADTVKFVRDEGGYVITKDNGNPAALKLKYDAGTGLFSGSFKIFGVTSSGRSKTYTATVRGGVLDGVGYGTAVVKKIGSIPVAVE